MQKVACNCNATVTTKATIVMTESKRDASWLCKYLTTNSTSHCYEDLTLNAATEHFEIFSVMPKLTVSCLI